jgi:hypothetical protein
MRARHPERERPRARDVDRLGGRAPGPVEVPAQPIGVGQVGEDACFGFQSGSFQPRERQRLLEVVGRASNRSAMM